MATAKITGMVVLFEQKKGGGAQVTFPGPIQALLLLQGFASSPVSIDNH